MLSQENIDKLVENGLYTCDPILELLPSYKRTDPYHCINWTFYWHRGNDNNYYMEDTYWSNNKFSILLTDENFDKFRFLFKPDDANAVSAREWHDYDDNDKWRVALDSGGVKHPRYIIKKDAKKNLDYVIEMLKHEIRTLEVEIECSINKLEKKREELQIALKNKSDLGE